jgi:hypothetical protein
MARNKSLIKAKQLQDRLRNNFYLLVTATLLYIAFMPLEGSFEWMGLGFISYFIFSNLARQGRNSDLIEILEDAEEEEEETP